MARAAGALTPTTGVVASPRTSDDTALLTPAC